MSFTIDRGDRIALVGVNGAGKSTLIRMLSGMEPPSSGTLRLGHNVTAEYFAQDQYKVLDGDARMLDDISNTAPRVSTTELRSLLGLLSLFRRRCLQTAGRALRRRAQSLCAGPHSGEPGKLPVAGRAYQPSRFAGQGCSARGSSLRFNGTVVMVSHDRYFIDRLATRIFEVEGGHVHVYPGNYEDYLHRKQHGRDTGEPCRMAPRLWKRLRRRLRSMQRLRWFAGLTRSSCASCRSAAALSKKRFRGWRAPSRVEESLGVYESTEETQRVTQLLENLREQHASLTAEWEELVSAGATGVGRA